MDETTREKALLSPSKTATGLRRFIYAAALWGAWGQAVGGAIFTGYALWLGATDADFGILTSLTSFASFVQIFAVFPSNRTEHKKRFVLIFGFFEIFFRFSMVLIPFLWLPRSLWVPAMMALLVIGVLSGNILSPLFSTWMVNTIPANIRARYTSRRTVISTLVAIVMAYALGQFMDLFPKSAPYPGFFWIFLFSLATGWGGYLMLARAPFPHTEEPETASRMNLRALLEPFREGKFLRLLIFYTIWAAVGGIASPFYTVFMLKTLGLNYATIALFTNLSMGASLAGYWFWGVLVDRYGSKPVLQLTLVPMVGITVLWVFNSPDHYVFIPVAMILGGLLSPGISVAVTTLLYGIVSERRETSMYFASWSSAVNVIYSIAPILGAVLVRRFEPVHFPLLGVPVGNLQIVFFISACGMILPILLLRFVQESRVSITPRQMLAQIGRGNPFTFAYHSLVFALSAEESRRAQAIRSMGRSKSPMAVEKLINAMSDLSHRVRSQAAEALGHTGAEEAVESLVQHLADEESDIQAEAAEALGRIGHTRGIDPLFQALRNEDLRVRISAIRALADIGGKEVREQLFWMFCEEFDRNTFPTLVEALSTSGDLRIVKPTLERLNAYRSPVIRSQLLNAICRLLGAGNQFYRILSQDELGRTTRIEGLLKKTRRALLPSKNLDREGAAQTRKRLRQVEGYLEEGEYRQMVEGIQKAAQALWDALNSDPSPSAQAAMLAIGTLLEAQEEGEPSEEEIICATISLAQLVQAVSGLSSRRRRGKGNASSEEDEMET